MEINSTINFMLSNDFKERFIAEYWQTKIRYDKLKSFNNRILASIISDDVEEPTHSCPTELLKEQQTVMGRYLQILEIRAVIEGIDLNEKVLNHYVGACEHAER